ncbi:MAG: hypothetical protein ACREC9_13615 [Methylocella sp.]
MTTIQAGQQAAYRRMINQLGQSVQMQRLTGAAPSVTTFSVTVTAIVRAYAPDRVAPAQEGYSASAIGGITQTDRIVLIMAPDLAAAGFPLPVAKNDKVILSTTGEKLDVTRVDGEKRSQAGCIEVFGAGVQ